MPSLTFDQGIAMTDQLRITDPKNPMILDSSALAC